MSRFDRDEERVAQYRKLADDAFELAGQTSDTDIRSLYIDIASSYLKMAQHIETSDWRRALRGVRGEQKTLGPGN